MDIKRQRRNGWQRNNRWQDQQGQDQKGSGEHIVVPERNGKSVKAPSSRPKKVHANMLQTCRETLIRMRSRIVRECFFVRARINPPCEQIKSESPKGYVTKTSIAKAIAAKEKAEHIERVAAIVDSENYAGVPFGGLQQNR